MMVQIPSLLLRNYFARLLLGRCYLWLVKLLVKLSVENCVWLSVVKNGGLTTTATWLLIVQRSSQEINTLVKKVNVAEGLKVNDAFSDGAEPSTRMLLHFLIF